MAGSEGLRDTTLDKPYARRMDLVTYHWSGKHQRVVKGIALLTLLWTKGPSLIPCDFLFYDIYDKPQGERPKTNTFKICSGRPRNGALRQSMC